MKSYFSIALILATCCSTALGQKIPKNVNEQIFQAYFQDGYIALFAEEYENFELTEEVKNELKHHYLTFIFGYWISVKYDIIPKNVKAEKTMKVVLQNLEEGQWLSLKESVSKRNSISYLEWYERHRFEEDFEAFRREFSRVVK